MANPARKKGSAWEVELLGWLRNLFGGQVDRAPLKGINDRGDFLGLPDELLVEAKSTIRPNFLEWARTCERKADRWWVVWHGDRRKPGSGPFVLMPLAECERLVSKENQ